MKQRRTPSKTTGGAASENGNDTQAVILLRIAARMFDVRRTQRGDVVGIPKSGAQVIRPLRGKGLTVSGQLMLTFGEMQGKPPAAPSLTSALAFLDAQAHERPAITVHLRVARYRDGLVIDMGDDAGRVLAITKGSWKMLKAPPEGVYFYRTVTTRPIATPQRPGNLDLLRKVLPVDDSSWDLIVPWLVCVWLLPDLPVPALALMGVNGAAKTYIAKTVRRIVDPCMPEMRATPTNPHDWIITADSARVVGLDNLSAIPEWLSDAICRAVTGEGYSKRALYTDAALYATQFHRAILLTSIDPGALRGDLGERLLPVELDAIGELDRKTENELRSVLESVLPQVLAGLLDLAAYVLAHPVKPRKLPRMADAAVIMAAIDAKRDSKALEAYYAAQEGVTQTVLESDPLAAALLAFMRDKPVWTGTATELMEALAHRKTDRNWPANARGLSARLRRMTVPLMSDGLEVTYPTARVIALKWSLGKQPVIPPPSGPKVKASGSTA